ncbi:hypothetical protein PR048_012828 [Dryococelus australis]|uniref:Maturase n=1 Tax=Dryococelus australis TaxID=614101 RepID=A0ABQ9HQL5_9NEOP|nr:hypothetical protein PR048_012828 [Dryococelus australis]
MLQRIHEGHMGIVKCRHRVHKSLRDSENISITCRHWELLGLDILELKQKQYLEIQNYFSRFLEVVSLDKTTSSVIIVRIQNIFARHDIPAVVGPDGGTSLHHWNFSSFSRNTASAVEHLADTFSVKW